MEITIAFLKGKPRPTPFKTRPEAQARANDLYGTGQIDKAEWTRIFNLLSEPKPH